MVDQREHPPFHLGPELMSTEQVVFSLLGGAGFGVAIAALFAAAGFGRGRPIWRRPKPAGSPKPELAGAILDAR